MKAPSPQDERARIEALHRQVDQLSANKEETDRLLSLAQKSRRALLSVLEDERLAGQKLRESEERFRQLAENIQEVFWITDPACTQIFYVSPAYEKIWGRTCADLYARPLSWIEAIHPEDRDAVHHAAMTGFVDGTFNVEYRIIRPDGSIRWIRDRAFPVANPGGAVNRIVGIARDVTESKHAEDELLQREDDLAQAQRVAKLGSWRYNTTSNKVRWSDELFRIFEIEQTGFDGTYEAFFTCVLPDDRPKVLQANAEATVRGTSFEIEYRIQTSAGDLKTIREIGRAKKDAGGKVVELFGTAQDITEYERAIERIAEQAAMLDLAHEAIMVRDIHSCRITYWNQGAERLYGWSAAEAHGRDMGELIFAIPDALDRVTLQAIESGEWRGEHRHLTKAGRELTVSSHVTLLRNPDGAPKSALVINIDITSQKLLEEQFLRAQRMESIGTLAAGVAHDLNNILAPILMSVPLLRDELPEDFRQRIVSTIESSARRGVDIVKQVLTFARGVRGERILVQPNHLIEEMVKIAQQTFPKSIAVRTAYPYGIWAVEGDPTQLHQVLLNLCVNARDAMPAGGELTVSLENITIDDQFAGMVPGSTAGPHVVIAVRDTGTGIPSAVIDKIFDPFFTTKETGKGTGLGLSTVIGIVKSHGGFITVDSETGIGATFKIFLPATTGEGGAASAVDEASVPCGNGELILIVDDEESIRQITQTILEKYGYRVLTAADGAEALARFAAQMTEIKAVLADIMMPLMDGLALARVLQRMSPNTPVIACTGQSEEVRETNLLDSGVKILLKKPYDTAKLLTALRSVLDTPEPPNPPIASQ